MYLVKVFTQKSMRHEIATSLMLTMTFSLGGCSGGFSGKRAAVGPQLEADEVFHPQPSKQSAVGSQLEADEVSHQNPGFQATRAAILKVRSSINHSAIRTTRRVEGIERVSGPEGVLRTLVLTRRLAMDKCLLLFYAYVCLKPACSSNATEISEEEYVVKYVDNCLSRLSGGKADPLYDEYVFSKVINELMGANVITPEVLGFSDQFVPNEFELGKHLPEDTEISFMVDNVESCRGSSARFIVEKRVGLSLFQLIPLIFANSSSEFDYVDKTILAAKIFVKGILLLQKIHAIGIVHGDIHPGNIALADYKTDAVKKMGIVLAKDNIKSSFVLIDFGKARFVPEIDPSIEEDIAGMTLQALSPWRLQRKPPSFRDDVFRMYEVLLNLLDQAKALNEHYKRFGTSVTDADALAEAKLSPIWISESNLLGHITDEEYKQELLEKLIQLHILVTRDEDTPPYDAILRIAKSLTQ